MSRIAIATDTNSGITAEEGKKLGVYVLPMPLYVNETLYFEDKNLTQEEFYAMLEQDASVSTSQPSPGDVMDFWDSILKEFDEIVYIPMSSGLSSSCHTAISLSEDYEGKVCVVDNQRISVTQAQSVLDALRLAENGLSAAQIKEILEKESRESSIYLVVDTLTYLKKGGRITPAAAMIGSALNLKPVLQIQGDKLDAYKKVRGMKAAKKTLLDAMRKDVEGRFSSYVEEGTFCLHVAHSNNEEILDEWVAEVQAAFPNLNIVRKDGLPLSIACHTGPGVLAVAATHELGKK